ncbi:pppde peptidase domain protein [Cystoisospora suis]|uniref:Pppde peptidase domain protein n=1 Tax=Cystoisospora suis TaxID=483139 RepID=A0A2C6KGP8_9APIC|nr:pppde peptidase domain protein [Cystoisospora suis]
MREDGTFTTRHPSTSSSLSSHSASPLFPHLSSLPLDLHSFAVDRRRQDLLACAAACADLEKLDTFSVSSHSHQRDERKVGGSTTSNLSHTSSLIEHTGKSDLHPSPSPPLPSPNTVYLHVYDLDPTISKYVNKVMRPLGAGAFHAGVEVYGIEYCYGQTCDDSSGITINRPRKHPVHIYRETIVMGYVCHTLTTLFLQIS